MEDIWQQRLSAGKGNVSVPGVQYNYLALYTPGALLVTERQATKTTTREKKEMDGNILFLKIIK